MKKILFISILFLSVSCHPNPKPIINTIPSTIVVCDSVNYYKHQNDSLKTSLFLYKYRVEQVKFYINLCEKKPSQKVFLLGWVKRAVQ